MNRRKLCSLTVSFLLGVAAAEFFCGQLALVCFVYFCFQIKSIRRAYEKCLKKQFLWVLVLMAFFLAGGCRNWQQNSFRAAYEPLLTDGQECFVQGKIDQKEQKKNQNLFYLKDCYVQLYHKNYPCNHILVILDADSYSIGETICVKGKIKTFSVPKNDGNYNEKSYYQSLKIDFKVESGEVTGVYGMQNTLKEHLYQIKLALEDSYQKCFNASDAGVVTAMTVGDKNRMESDVKELYQKAGISHFYCVSGLHISMLGMALYGFLRKRKASYYVAGITAGGVIFCYGMLTGFGISQTRAVGMFLLLLYAKCRGRSYDRMTALTLLAAGMVWENTGLLHHAGFLLSFGAVAGVLLAEYVLEQKNFAGIKETFVVSLCIQMVTTPIMCHFFYEISVYAVLINLFILPCMGVLLGVGLLGGAVGCFSVKLGSVLLFPCHLILLMYEKICSIFLGFPYASWITGKPDMTWLLFWYGCLFVLLFFIKKEKYRKIAPMIPVLLCILLILPSKKQFRLDVLDVGQGDGIYLSAGDGTNLFIDGGSTDISKIGIYRILPFFKYHKIRQIDYWFVSHCDEDHISGLREVMKSGYKIRNLVVSDAMPQDEAYIELISLAKKQNISCIKMKQNAVLKGTGGKVEENWNIRCLFPEIADTREDRNEKSMVLLYESREFCGLFTGDLPAEQEKILLTQCKLPEVDFYKAAHHGSKYSNSEELLQAIKPEITVISCSLYNRYGHPGKETINRLKEVETQIYETRYQGQITITEKPYGNALEAEVSTMIE